VGLSSEDIGVASSLRVQRDDTSDDLGEKFTGDLYHIGIPDYGESRAPELHRWLRFFDEEAWAASVSASTETVDEAAK